MNKMRLKVMVMLLLVPVMVLSGYWIGGGSGWERLWPFLLGYLIGAVYAWMQVTDKLKLQR